MIAGCTCDYCDGEDACWDSIFGGDSYDSCKCIVDKESTINDLQYTRIEQSSHDNWEQLNARTDNGKVAGIYLIFGGSFNEETHKTHYNVYKIGKTTDLRRLQARYNTYYWAPILVRAIEVAPEELDDVERKILALLHTGTFTQLDMLETRKGELIRYSDTLPPEFLTLLYYRVSEWIKPQFYAPL